MTATRNFRALIVDDERLARQRLEDLLAGFVGWEIAGQADDGESAVRAIRELKPDLVFLDIQMPGLTGIDVVRRIGVELMPATIFVTAYDQYALKAFEAAALDYLVKPFDDDRFAETLRRAGRLLELKEAGDLKGQLNALLSATASTASAAKATAGAGSYLERIAVEMRGQVRVVATQDIDFISASGPYAELHVNDKTFVIRERMQTLEDRLDPRAFMRIHRSAIVRLDRIDSMLREPGGDYSVKLKNGARLSVSRNRVEPLEAWMGIARQSPKNA